MTAKPPVPRLTDVLDGILREARFDAGPNGVHAATAMLGAHTGGDQVREYIASTARLVVPNPLLVELVESLEPELRAYIEPESRRIGTGLIALMGGALDSAEPTVDEFAQILIKAAALLGSTRAVEILRGWITGEPYRYRMKVLLTGIQCDQPLALEEGLWLEQLPKGGYPRDLMPYLPPLSRLEPHTNVYDLFGRVVLSIDGTASPTLYRPSRSHGDKPDWNLHQIWAQGEIPCLTNEWWEGRLTEVLAVACDHYVDWTHCWRDVGDLVAFNHSGISGPTFKPHTHSMEPVTIAQEHLEQARDLDVQRHVRSQTGQSPERAIKRWVASKRPHAALDDRFADLRIAFESLYAPDSRAELSFRVAFLGAWHLGTDFATRRRYYDLLREAYKQSSTAVHDGDVKNTEKNRDTLANAQQACREAILKLLAEPAQLAPDSVDVALGALLQGA